MAGNLDNLIIFNTVKIEILVVQTDGFSAEEDLLRFGYSVWFLRDHQRELINKRRLCNGDGYPIKGYYARTRAEYCEFANGMKPVLNIPLIKNPV